MAYVTVTLADLKVALDERHEEVRFWTDEESRLALNEALREWNLWTGRWRRTVLLDSLANTWEYTLPTSLTYGMAVRYNNFPLVLTSTFDLELGRPTWRTETVITSGDVPTRPTLWAPLSLQQIQIWPSLVAAGFNDFSVEGVSATPILIEDADTVDVGDETIDILADYALHVLSFKLGGARWQATIPYWEALLQAAAKENGRLKANQKFRRAAGLNRRIDLSPTTDRPTQMDGMTA